MYSLRLALVVLFSSLSFSGCGDPIQLQPLPIGHPANPEAPEAPVQGPPKALRDDPGANPSSSSSSERPMDHQHQTEGGNQTKPPTAEAESPEGAVYSCPMHPEVKASAPGRCAKCGMALKQEGAK